ncbi:L,D-transpeptidase family protein [Parasphingopyxis marina]|uniref:L,D-transpeptidase family protein n=1 Tax=Parasphingopyxis marina TaxID=2761622 RepID=A0A842HYC5_9SPHN|nr:L,D-transpeptidase family protein [Parasphingopyxis marina]MBC2777835.1 L,D-transpeptidase family protein [Parasphingopyxis marina]
MRKFLLLLILLFSAPAVAQEEVDPVCTFAETQWPGADPAAEPAHPAHPHYAALQRAYAQETDPGRRATLAANIRRWEAMPHRLGDRYLLVNAAAFRATLWEDGSPVSQWRVIVGRTRTQTPIFHTEARGVILNPWWEIPASIVAESVGALVRNRPAEARRRGYVVQGGRYRQRPGPGNALGLMKLDMPNAHSVGIHDTPSRQLFDREDRALSHGCVRIDDALGFATTLLSRQPEWTRERVDAVIAVGETRTVPFDAPLPVYIGYFTAEPAADGTIGYFPDIYGRD